MKNPKLITKPFAQNGQKNAIPENYSSSMESNQATWDQGFGQITMIPVAAGGLPPKGQDFNGIFNQISENVVYLSKGGRFKFSADYAAAINGYPKGAILQSDDEKKEYQSLLDNNKVNFNTATQAQINAAWKLISTDDMLQQLAGKQPAGNYALKGDSYTKVESDTKFQPKGNYAPAGNYQPAGDYATTQALNSGLDKKFDKTGGSLSGSVTAKNAITATGDEAGAIAVQLNIIDGKPNVRAKTNNNWFTSYIPEKNGTIMQLGDYGWGGSVENNWLLSESSISNKLRNTSTPTQVWRNNNTTKFNQNYSANAYIKCGDCWFNLSVGYGTGVLTIASGNGSTEKVSTVYSTINTLKDRNGCLKAIGTSEELSDCQVGVPLPWPQATAPVGYLVCNGQSFNKTSYPLLAKAYPSGALPDLRGEFIRGLDAGRNIDSGRGVLSTQGDAIRNMTGEVHGVAIDGNGVFTNRTLVYTSATPNGSGKDMYKVTFDPSKAVPTANENRPRNIAFLYIVRAA